MQRICLLFAILLLCVLQSCQANQFNSKQPEWLSGNIDQYPSTQFIFGRGMGETYEIAKTNAMADLAYFFDATVTSGTKSIEQESSQTSNGKTITTSGSYFASQVKVFSSAKLQFIEVAENWQDPDTKSYHVLVVMDRRKMCQFYHNLINENEKLMGNYMLPSDDVLQRYANLVKAISLSTENDQFYLYHNGLAIMVEDRIKPPYTSKELIEYMLQAGKNIRFNLVISGDCSNTISTALTNAIQKLGFSYGKDTEIDMTVSINEGSSQQMNKQYFTRYSASLQVSRAGEKLFEIKEEVMQGDTDLILSFSRTLRALGASLSTRFKREFSDYLRRI